MSRQLDNLKRIFGKMQARYGDGDAMVSELKHDVELREGIESGYRQWIDSHIRGIPVDFSLRRRARIEAGHWGR